LSVFFCPLNCLFFNLRLLITPTLNILYCSIINNWIGHKFHNLETSSPIHTWINTKWTYTILYTYFIFSEDMKKNDTNKKKVKTWLTLWYLQTFFYKENFNKAKKWHWDGIRLLCFLLSHSKGVWWIGSERLLSNWPLTITH
jgi:hypothetical protein